MSADSRWGAVDLLRGFAVIGVIAAHCVYAVPAIGTVLFSVLRVGQFGVDLFFVISGFVLCESIHRRQLVGAAPDRWGFFKRRMKRLVPLYLVGVMVYGFLIDGHLQPRGESIPIEVWIANVLLLNGWQPGWESSVVPGGWSIGAEATFAILLALVFPWIRSLSAALWFWLGTVVVSVFLGDVIAEFAMRLLSAEGDAEQGYFVVRHLPTFAVGMVAWHTAQQGIGRGLSLPVRWGMRLFVVGVLIGRSFGVGAMLDRSLVVGSAMLLVVLTVEIQPVKSFAARGMAWVGRYSYGSYLVHFAVLWPAEVLIVAMLPVGASALLMYALLLMLVCGLTFPIAWLLENLLRFRLSPR